MTSWNGNSYEYDALGMMIRMVAGGEDWRYLYTADDERFWSQRTAGGGNRPATSTARCCVSSRYTSRGPACATTHYHNGQLLASNYPGEGDRHFSLDHLGTPQAITDSAGVAKIHLYLPYGEELSSPTLDAERMKFTGHERDFASLAGVADDLDYMHARHYNPLTGRFLSTDRVGGSIRRPQSWNRYAYALGNPLRLVDPDGLKERDALSTYVVRVNVVYSSAHKPTKSGQSLRAVTERGISAARGFFAKAGIALQIVRHEAQISMGGPAQLDPKGSVMGSDISKFATEQKQLSVIVSGDANAAGKTVGVGGPSLLGVMSDTASLTDELAHALGNVTPLGNTVADVITDLNELSVALGFGLDQQYEAMLRDAAAQVGCTAGTAGCPSPPN